MTLERGTGTFGASSLVEKQVLLKRALLDNFVSTGVESELMREATVSCCRLYNLVLSNRARIETYGHAVACSYKFLLNNKRLETLK